MISRYVRIVVLSGQTGKSDLAKSSPIARRTIGRLDSKPWDAGPGRGAWPRGLSLTKRLGAVRFALIAATAFAKLPGSEISVHHDTDAPPVFGVTLAISRVFCILELGTGPWQRLPEPT